MSTKTMTKMIAANLLTKEFREEHPDVPWREIVDMRNVLVHGYFYNKRPVYMGDIHQRFTTTPRECNTIYC